MHPLQAITSKEGLMGCIDHLLQWAASVAEEAIAAAATDEAHEPACKALLVFNLFGLEAYHVAEALSIPCMVASPCLVPYSAPSSFARRFQQSCPATYQWLKSNDDVPGNEACAPIRWT